MHLPASSARIIISKSDAYCTRTVAIWHFWEPSQANAAVGGGGDCGRGLLKLCHSAQTHEALGSTDHPRHWLRAREAALSDACREVALAEDRALKEVARRLTEERKHGRRAGQEEAEAIKHVPPRVGFNVDCHLFMRYACECAPISVP